MKQLFKAYLRLIRWPNLLFIALTQVLFSFCITIPIFSRLEVRQYMSLPVFLLYLLSSLFIAAAGYIINDYFDVNIDKINKPERLIVGRLIKRRTAIKWHMLLSIIGIIATGYAVIKNTVFYKPYEQILILIINVMCVFLLWLYSTTYKKKLIVGNVLISLLTAWTIFMLHVAEIPYYIKSTELYQTAYQQGLLRHFKFAIIYSSFAFIITIIREAVKDVEDMVGDSRNGCTTMPIVLGVPTTKMYIVVWSIVLLAAVIILQVYAVHLGWWSCALYCTLSIVLPMVWFLKKLVAAATPNDFGKLSGLVKFIMAMGILSMFAFQFYL